MDAKLPGLSKQVAAGFAQSLQEITGHHLAIRSLTKELRLYEARLTPGPGDENQLNGSQARHLIRTARSMLQLCREDSHADFVPFCLAAVDYLVSTDDAQNDFDSAEGLDDDQQVMDAVIRQFSLADRLKEESLSQPLPRRAG